MFPDDLLRLFNILKPGKIRRRSAYNPIRKRLSSGPPIAIFWLAHNQAEAHEEKLFPYGTVHLKNVPPVRQRTTERFPCADRGGSRMICLVCGQKVRWWQSKVSSVISENRYHWGCLWDSGGNNHGKRNGNGETSSPSRPRHSPGYRYPSRLSGNDRKGGGTRGQMSD